MYPYSQTDSPLYGGKRKGDGDKSAHGGRKQLNAQGKDHFPALPVHSGWKREVCVGASGQGKSVGLEWGVQESEDAWGHS